MTAENKDFFEALSMLEHERGITAEYLIEKIKAAIIIAVKKNYEVEEDHIRVDIDPDTGRFDVALIQDIVADEDWYDEHAEIGVTEARKIRSSYEVGDRIITPLKTRDFGRIAAQTAKHVIRQGIREAERNQQLSEIQSRAHDIVQATVTRVDTEKGIVALDLGKGGEAVLPRNEQVPGEELHEGQMVKVYLVEVRRSTRGPQVLISRTHPGLVKRLFELEVPEIYADPKKLRALTREQKELSAVVEAYRAYQKCEDDIVQALELVSDPELKDMAQEELNTAKAEKERLFDELRVLLLPRDPNDGKNVIMELRGGVGGEESALFAADLYRMYSMYAEKHGWKIELLNYNDTELGGVKEADFILNGAGAWSRLKFESGVHRVQRVPETESGGRIHTSTISVAVMPEVDDDIDIVIEDKDIRIDVMRASGNGGQCVNTTDSAVRLTHYPSGIVVYSQTEKSQIQNKAKAFALLKSKLYDIEQQQRHDAEAEMRRSQIGTGDRSEKIRTYNFPQGRVTDHRIGLTLYKLDKIMNGDIEEIIDACIAADQAAKLAKMNEE